MKDGPASTLFDPIAFKGNVAPSHRGRSKVSKELKEALPNIPKAAEMVCSGIPFVTKDWLLSSDRAAETRFKPAKTPWVVFLHAQDFKSLDADKRGFIAASPGVGRLAEAVADYVLLYADGTEARHTVRGRIEIGMLVRPWGENGFACVAQHKPHPLRNLTEQPNQSPFWAPEANYAWGQTQAKASSADLLPWGYWVWAWQNPHPRKAVVGLRIEPREGTAIVAGITAGRVSSMPYRWESRRKAILKLPKGTEFDPELDSHGLLSQIRLDLGQVISAQRRTVYPNEAWPKTHNNQLPELSEREVLVEYAAHPQARFHLWDGKTVPVAKLAADKTAGPLRPVASATQEVVLRVIDRASKMPVAVKLHVHGEAGEYLPPIDRHRMPNPHWFEDYAPEFVGMDLHAATYINGETRLKLPVGRVFIELSKGFEIKPVRKVVEITPRKRSITVAIDKVLPWRERGWITADTHVHFLSPETALLEGAAEGVNVVNLLASQWGELFTNIGDFDGKTTIGSKEAGGDGEYLVRVGTENRQHVLGHISLLGYEGKVIAPLTTGGADESAIGDPIENLLSEWARQCRKQGGLVVLPHFPNPRCEGASCLVQGDIDAVEMTSWGQLFGGIDPYSLSDWYRYLNCGYFVPAVAGTDKMGSQTPVGCIRTYARLPRNRAFDYATWMDAVRSGDTFVTYGPLLEFRVDGKRPGQRFAMKRSGGTVSVEWEAESVTKPMTRVELVVNGEVRESQAVKPRKDSGYWTVKLEKSSWLALMVRGHYPETPEYILAHSSPVMLDVAGTAFYAAADALTILDQIEGAMAFFDTVGTRAEDRRYKAMKMILSAAHRNLHNRMHAMGHYHEHSTGQDHREHH